MTILEQIKIAATIALGLTLGIALLNTWVYPTNDGLTIGVGSYGYHIEFNKEKGS